MGSGGEKRAKGTVSATVTRKTQSVQLAASFVASYQYRGRKKKPRGSEEGTAR